MLRALLCGVLLAAAGGCAPLVQVSPAPVFRGVSARPSGPQPGAVALVERALRARGLRFGTDGSPGALHHFLRQRHRAVDFDRARPGDVVFFRIDPDARGCDHAGIVEAVDATGRLTFREWRDGAELRSHAHPAEPRARRDREGRVLNSFLRIKRPDDPAEARYHAGEMLCALFRPRL